MGGDCTIRVAKTKALISFAVTAKLICVFVFAYAKRRFSHDAAHFVLLTVPRRYFRFGSLCLLVFVSVSVLFSHSMCLNHI